MNCPYCNAELMHEDSFGTLDFINGRDRNGKRGDIAKDQVIYAIKRYGTKASEEK